MENLSLSHKGEKEVLNSIRMMALANLTEDSVLLLTIDDIAIMANRNRSIIDKKIVKSPSFPKPVTIDPDNQNPRPRYIAGEVVRWFRANSKRFK